MTKTKKPTAKIKHDIKTGIAYHWVNKDLAKTPLLMLHGHGADHQAFQDIADKLNYPLLIIDLPGFGTSHQLKTHTVENIADHIKKFMNNLKIDRYAVLGHSFGTIVGLKLAENNSSCTKLILLNPLPRFKPVMENFYYIFGKTFKNVPENISDTVLNSRVYKSAGYLLHSRQSLGRDYLENLFYPPVIYEDFKSRVWRESWLSIHDVDQFRLAEQVECPTLIMHGNRDSLTNAENVELFAGFFPQSRLVKYINGGHIMHREITDEVVPEIIKFLESDKISEKILEI